MKTSKSFQELNVWQKSHNLVLEIYKISKSFPKEEIFGLIGQIRRAGVSIPANIAEGYKRLGKQDKIRFFNIAQSSLEEVKYYLILIKDLGYSETKILSDLAIEIGKMLNAYIRSIGKDLS